jgi:hypothetical protein
MSFTLTHGYGNDSFFGRGTPFADLAKAIGRNRTKI